MYVKHHEEEEKVIKNLSIEMKEKNAVMIKIVSILLEWKFKKRKSRERERRKISWSKRDDETMHAWILYI